MTKLIRRNFKVEKEEWEEFKNLCNENGSNASVELRKFIKDYNNKHVTRKFDFDKALKRAGEKHSNALKRLAKK